VSDGGEVSPRQRALALLSSQPRDGTPGVSDVLQRLCRALTDDLDLAGATVTLIPELGSHTVAAASSPAARRTEDLQFDAGEGPTREAYHFSQPVLIGDLEQVLARWPGFTSAALDAGLSATFALPLQVGAARIGALTLYWQRPHRPADTDLRTALVFADLATELLIDNSLPDAETRTGLEPALVSALDSAIDSPIDVALDAAMDMQGHIYQAQGMVMVDLGIRLPEALARMRAQAYATGQSLAMLASQIIDGTTVLSKDPTGR
jgi:hypothetical protein